MLATEPQDVVRQVRDAVEPSRTGCETAKRRVPVGAKILF
ncbi:hypothetical protein LEP1GSC058_2411 [Leptospira fainei serovar Hurstbridge str. BUT 6]|uniref:Uncharacterized protein n=1 Tax=Leptospira fainei serovar Hurstbridge str. BUT 6 TaxID=1193011 RepID=S3UUJ1_9LEPT|nr:hypothetical protein LEP1GSC058_2411 [Leptospira fainei serovar Hurstbridge str. BUT 6]